MPTSSIIISFFIAKTKRISTLRLFIYDFKLFPSNVSNWIIKLCDAYIKSCNAHQSPPVLPLPSVSHGRPSKACEMRKRQAKIPRHPSLSDLTTLSTKLSSNRGCGDVSSATRHQRIIMFWNSANSYSHAHSCWRLHSEAVWTQGKTICVLRTLFSNNNWLINGSLLVIIWHYKHKTRLLRRYLQ